MKSVQVPIAVSLKPQDYEKLLSLVDGDMLPAHKIQSITNGLLDDLVSGGLMLSGDDVKRIHEVAPGAGPEEIIGAVEEQGGMEDGQIKIPFYLDTTLREPLQNIADMQGFTLQEVVQNAMDHAIEQGWFYALEPQPRVLFFEQADYRKLSKAMGKESPTGADLIQWLTENGLAEQNLDELFEEEPKKIEAPGTPAVAEPATV